MLAGVRSSRSLSAGTACIREVFAVQKCYLHVGVVGCGVAGLQVVRALQAKGIRATAFDKAPDVGGLWRQNYVGYGVQVPKQFYEFPDYPVKQVPWGGYAKGKEIQKYIKDYVEHFKLENALQLSTSVKEVKPSEAGGWTFVTESDAGHSKEHKFDYAVVCTGMYSQVKKIPKAFSEAEFQGKLVHSSEFLNEQEAKGKHVLVVGGAKSALDCALQSERAGASSVTVLQRRAHWPTPRLIAGCVPFQYVFLSRFGTYLVSAHSSPFPGCSLLMRLFEKFMKPLLKPVFASVELLFSLQFRLFGEFRPKEDVVKDYYNSPHILDNSFRDAVKSKRIQLKNGEVARCSGKKVELHNGAVLSADLVISGTGFRKDYSIFPEKVRINLGLENDGLYLYRHVLPPNVPDLAFVGSEVSSNSNILTHGLQAEWLARRLSGVASAGLQPSKASMAADVETMKAWKRSWMPKTSSRASMVLLHHTHYHDQLLKDMGERRLRKWPNLLAEFFMPYRPGDYDGIMGKTEQPLGTPTAAVPAAALLLAQAYKRRGLVEGGATFSHTGPWVFWK